MKSRKVEKIIVIILVASLLAALLFVVRENFRLRAREEAIVEEAARIAAEEIKKKYAEIDEQNNKLTEEIEGKLEAALDEQDKQLEIVKEFIEKEVENDRKVREFNEYVNSGELSMDIIPVGIKSRVVGIKGRTVEGNKIGEYDASAFSMFEPGLYITCYHCIDGEDLKLVVGGKEYGIEVLKVDKDHDLALIRSEKKLGSLEKTSHEVKQNSLYLNVHFIEGSLVGYYTTMVYMSEELDGEVRRINAFFPEFPGGSGSPLIDANGAVVGVFSQEMRFEEGNPIKVCVPIKYAEKLYEEYKKDER